MWAIRLYRLNLGMHLLIRTVAGGRTMVCPYKPMVSKRAGVESVEDVGDGFLDSVRFFDNVVELFVAEMREVDVEG